MDLSWVARLIAQNARYVYILCAIGIAWYLRKALATRREGSQAIFSLEREHAAKSVYRSSAMVFVLLVIAVGVYALRTYADIPQPDTSPIEIATSTPELATPTRASPLATPGEPTGTAEPTATRRTSVLTVVAPTLVQPTPTLQVAPASCPHPNVQLIQPGQNQAINEGVQVRGTANKEDFDRYEFKFQSRDFEDEWHWVETFRTPVENGDLGWWATSHLPNGNYRFMLIAIDQRGNSQECVVPVVIKH
jgi:hypothetical protein